MSPALNQHTPGTASEAWQVCEPESRIGLMVKAIPGQVIADICPCDTPEETLRIARLIAAAPELLEAAREGLIAAEADIEDRLHKNEEAGDDPAEDTVLRVFEARAALIRAAIAKATGNPESSK